MIKYDIINQFHVHNNKFIKIDFVYSYIYNLISIHSNKYYLCNPIDT